MLQPGWLGAQGGVLHVTGFHTKGTLVGESRKQIHGPLPGVGGGPPLDSKRELLSERREVVVPGHKGGGCVGVPGKEKRSIEVVGRL